MTELGAVFLLALATQGYTWTMQDGALLVERDNGDWISFPMELLEDDSLRPLLDEAIDFLMFLENGRFTWPPPKGSGRN